MRPFTFAPRKFAVEFSEKGYVFIRNGVSDEFLNFAKEQLARCRLSGRNELPAREIKGKKTQYLFDLPDESDFLRDLFQVIGALTNTPSAQMTLSERHIMVYDENAAPLPPLHKDRLASRFSVGMPLERCADGRIALLPYGPRGVNLLDNAVYCRRATDSLARSVHGWDLSDCEFPEAPTIDKVGLVELDAQPGDVVIFAGSSMYHGRLNAANSSILYFKLSTLLLDPLGEDPSTTVQRQSSLKILEHKRDEELLESAVELSPRLQNVSHQYTRLEWTMVFRASVSGEKEFTISDDESRFLFALQGRGSVKDVLMRLGIPEDRLLSHVPGIRRLGKRGAIDFLN